MHRLHPYLGKFVPQLVEALLDRYVPAGGRVLDPFAGSGTTLVQALESGHDATGVDVAGFNCLLMRVKTRPYNLDALRRDLLWAHAQTESFVPRGRYPAGASTVRADVVSRRQRPRSSCTSAASSSRRPPPTCSGSCSLVRRGRLVARRTSTSTSRAPHSSGRTGATSTAASAVPVETARQFLLRYTLDTLDRIETFATVRAAGARRRGRSTTTHETLDLRGPYDAVITSPPYPGLIDYHEQHRYAYELLGLDQRREVELGRPALGTGRAAIDDYVDGVAAVLRERRETPSRPKASCASSSTTDAISTTTSFRGPASASRRRLERHVNRRTGRRSGEYFESILVAVAD